MGLRTFLCRNEDERAWLVEMNQRIAPRIRRGFAAFGVFALLSSPWLHPLTLVLLAISAGVFEIANRRVQATSRIEPMVAAWFLSQAMFTATIVLNHGVEKGRLALLLIPVVAASGGLPTRVVVVCTAYTGLLMVGAGFLSDAGAIYDDPVLLFLPLGGLCACAVIASAVRRSSIENRAAAGVDPLTGMLNRNALEGRAAELGAQSQRTGTQVAAIVLDVDHFKSINDKHGHARGDDVLRELGHRLRTELRLYDLGYRLGGEEFLVLVPGGGPPEAAELAERLAAAVRSAPIAGLDLTVSAGVAASVPGEPFEWTEVFAYADAALYEAKRKGRDRVCTSEPALVTA